VKNKIARPLAEQVYAGSAWFSSRY